MAVIHGVKVKIYNGTTLLGGQTGVDLNVKQDTSECHVKNDFPAKKFLPSWYSWDCSFDGIVVDDTMASAVIAGTSISVKIESDSDASLEVLFSGTAYVTEWSLSAPQDGMTTFSCSLQGSGELTIGDESSSQL